MATEKPIDHPGRISRRGFLKGVGAGAVATGLLEQVRESAGIAQAQSKSTAGPGEVSLTLNVNGKDQTLKAEPRVTLLDALRNRSGRRAYVPARVRWEDGRLVARPVLSQGSADVVAHAQANALAILEAARTSAAAGERVPVVLLGNFLERDGQ